MANQDAAYQASLARDRAKLEEQRKRDAEAEAKTQAVQAAEAAREALEAARTEAIALALSRVTDEPAVGASGAFPIVVRLPGGGRLQRRFVAHDKVQLLLDWLHSEVELGEAGISLSLGFPSRELTRLETDNRATHSSTPELQQTLAEAGIQPRETLHLRYLNE